MRKEYLVDSERKKLEVQRWEETYRSQSAKVPHFTESPKHFCQKTQVIRFLLL